MKVNKHNHEDYSDLYIYILIRNMKGELDTIREMKGLDDSHDISKVSDIFENLLNDYEKQGIVK